MLVWMSDVGLQDPPCTKLGPHNGCVFSTAPFRMSCLAESRDIFYTGNEDSQPLGVELRDWIFYECKASSSETDVNSASMTPAIE